MSTEARIAQLETDVHNLILRVKDLEAKQPKSQFKKPTKEEVQQHMMNDLDEFTAMAQSDLFMNYFESNGWKVGSNKMSNWKAAVNSWVLKLKNGYATSNRPGNFGTQVRTGTDAAREAKAREQAAGNRSTW